MPIGHAVHQDQGAVLGSGTDPWSDVVIASGRNKQELAAFVAEMVLQFISGILRFSDNVGIEEGHSSSTETSLCMKGE